MAVQSHTSRCPAQWHLLQDEPRREVGPGALLRQVNEQSRAEMEGRASRGATSGRVIPLDEDGVPEEAVDYDGGDQGGSDGEQEEEYDSEDSGTEESGRCTLPPTRPTATPTRGDASHVPPST